MFYGIIENINGADYRFGSDSFKWVYYASIKYARHVLYTQHMEYSRIVIRFTNDIWVAIDHYGLTIDDNRRTFDINKEGR